MHRLADLKSRRQFAVQLLIASVLAGSILIISTNRVVAQEDALFVLIKSCKHDSDRCPPERLEALLDGGADPNYSHPQTGMTVLELAVLYGLDVSSIRVLVETGAHANSNPRIAGVLHAWASKMQYTCSGGESLEEWKDRFNLLLAAGANVKAERHGGRTPLMVLAVTGACLEAMALIIEHGADIDAQTEEGKTAIDFARNYLHRQQDALENSDSEWAQEYYPKEVERASQVVAFLRERANGGANTSQSTDGPQLPFVLQGVCPSEGCTYDRWIADEAIPVYTSEGDLSSQLFEVPRNQVYTASTGNLHIFRFHELTASERLTLNDYAASPPRKVAFDRGDKLYVLAHLGEGRYAAWHEEEVYHFHGLQSGWTDWCGAQIAWKSKCFEWVWWIRVRDERGRSGWIVGSGSSESALSYYTEQEADQLRWPTVEAAREFIEDRERVLFQTPVYEDDWRAKTAMILTAQWDEYQKAYVEALNNRTLAYESLQTAQRLLNAGKLGAANRHLEMHLYYFDVMIVRFKEIGRTLELSAETLQRVGQASTEVACLSTQMALISAGRPELKDVVSLLCIPVRFAVDVRLGEQFDNAAKDGATRIVTWAMWHWAANNAFNDWQEWDGWIEHTTRQGGSELYQRLTENVTTEQMHREIMELATEAPDFILGETFSQVSEDEVQEILSPVVEEMIKVIQSSAVGNAATGSPNRENP